MRTQVTRTPRAMAKTISYRHQWQDHTSLAGWTFLVLAILVCTVSLVASAHAQTRRPGDRLTRSDLSPLITALQPYVTTQKLAGIVTLVAHQGEVVHLHTMGDRELETGKRMTADTIFRIYSMSKPITSTAIMMLVERGKIRLDDPVEKYLPDLANPEVFLAEGAGGLVSIPAQSSITIEHLLTHTSGLTYGFSDETPVEKRYQEIMSEVSDGTLKQLVEKLGKTPLIAQPGSRFNYSISTAVLGRVIEVVSGKSLDTFIKDNITGPLGMYDTDFYVPDAKMYRFADNYSHDDNGRIKKVDDNETGEYSGERPSLLLGDAGMVSTITDYYRFCQMILDQGVFNRKRIMQASTIVLMSQNHLPEANPNIKLRERAKATGFGYGFAVIEDPHAEGVPGSPGELYWAGAASTIFWIDPVEQIIGILMTQHMPPPELASELRSKFKTVVYDALKQ